MDELIVPTSYPAKSDDDPAFALYVFYLQAGLVEVLPQKWFTASQYQVGKQWITRARSRSRVASHIRRMFRRGEFHAGRGWMPAGSVDREKRLALSNWHCGTW